MPRVSLTVCLLCMLMLVACRNEPRTDGLEEIAQVEADEGWMHASRDGLPSVSAESYLEAGRYLAVVALCNDCHTEGWLAEGTVPEDEWLAGSPVGLEGTWGVSFPSNLRLRAQEWTEDQWVEALRTRKAHERMPRIALNLMSEKDSRAFYRFLRYLGPRGEHTPDPIAPGEPIDHSYLSLRRWPAGTALEAVED